MDGVDQTFIILLIWYRLSDAKTQIINVIFFIHNLTHTVWTPNFSRCLMNCFYLTWCPSLLYPTAFQILFFSSKNYWAIYIYEPQFCRNDLWFLQGVTNFDLINNVKHPQNSLDHWSYNIYVGFLKYLLWCFAYWG